MDLFISDEREQCVASTSDVIYWSLYDSSEVDGVYSVPQLVAMRSELMRSRYLRLIYDIGNLSIGNKRVVDHLEIRHDFSYWWMTLLAEKCNFYKSPRIDDIIKLMAFREWINDKKYSRLILKSSNKELARSIKMLSLQHSIDFIWVEVDQKTYITNIYKKVYNSLPQAVQSFAWLVYNSYKNWPLTKVSLSAWQNTKFSTTFVSYLFNSDAEAVQHGKFKSNYWANLPEILKKNCIGINWMHIYVPDKVIPTAEEARWKIESFNDSGDQSAHVTLYSFLNFTVLLHTIKDWLFVWIKSYQLLPEIRKQTGIFWPLINCDYIRSMRGAPSISNILFMNLFEEAMDSLPKQKQGVYIQENQGWEFGFIYAWRKVQPEGTLIGVPHTPSKFWDLRSYFDRQTYTTKYKNNLPLPDYVGMNGPVAYEMYIKAGYPPNNLVDVEALRYLHLRYTESENDHVSIGTPQLLVLTDYSYEKTRFQLELLQNAKSNIKKKINILVKPHPACPVDKCDYPELDFEIVNGDIAEVIKESSIVYTSNTTSSAVDAYCANKIVISVLDPLTLNASPLMDVEGVTFVGTSDELSTELNIIDGFSDILSCEKEYFYLDGDLPRWRNLLVNSCNIKSVTNLEVIL